MADFNFLNSPDFGAFGGARFAQQQQKGALENIETMGKIGMQPGQAALRAAQARQYNAQAAEKEAASLSATSVSSLQEIAGRRFSGLPPDEFLIKSGELMMDAGQVKAGAELATKGFDIQSKQQTAATARSNELLHNIDRQRKQIQQAASEAGTVLNMQTQQEYDNWRYSQVGGSMNPDQMSDMPETLAEAQQILRPVFNQALSAKEQLDVKQREIEDADQRTRRSHQNARDTAAAKLSGARLKVVEKDYEDSVKNDGPGSPTTAARRRELIDASKEAREARERKEFPPLPTDPKEVVTERGKNTYKLPDGRKVYAVGKDKDGLPVFKLVGGK